MKYNRLFIDWPEDAAVLAAYAVLAGASQADRVTNLAGNHTQCGAPV